MKILVTGNLGYIGTVLSEELLKKNYYFEGIDCGFYKDDLLEEPAKPMKQYFCDIRKVDERMLSGIDAIVHLAGLSNDPLGEFEEKLTNEINFKSTVELAKLAKEKNIKRFIYSSSQSMYGISQTSEELDEIESEKNPLTSYGITKWESEQEILKLADENFNVVALRFSTVFGGGPRFCPGRNLAMLEIKMVISMLFKNFNIEMVTDHSDIREILAFTMMASDYKVRLTKRT